MSGSSKPRYVRLKNTPAPGCESEHRAALRDLAPHGIYKVLHVDQDGDFRSYFLRGGLAFYSTYLFEEMSE